MYDPLKSYTAPGAAAMRIKIEIDDELMAQAMRLSGLPTKRGRD